jgi:DNA invertase Pin-like site-specific DNA recombinase
VSLVGYARVSTDGQELHLQTDALESLGCDRIFTETASGAKADRPELAACLDYLREGDTLVVWRLDRLGRSTRHLLETVEGLDARGVQFRSVTEGIDTSTPGGKLIFTVFAALAEFERNLIRERTNAGLIAARRRNRIGGRRKVLTGAKLDQAREMKASGRYTVREIAEVVGVSAATLYRYLPEDGEAAASG